MRRDMVKAVRERPRCGDHEPLVRFKFKPLVNDYEDFDGGPRRVSITKEIPARSWYDRRYPDLLYGPLLKFLQSQVGRPWDNVWSEICEVTAGEAGYAVRDWLRNNVDILTKRHKDRLRSRQWYYHTYYVLEDGILRYEPRRSYPERQKPITTVRVNDKLFHRHNDLWYEIELAPLPKFEQFTRAWQLGKRTLYFKEWETKGITDLFLGEIIARGPSECRRFTETYGEAGYCVKKRSANSREVRSAKKALIALEKAKTKRS